MLYFKDLFNKLYIKFSKSKFVKWLFPVFLLVLMPNVKAFNLGPGVPLTYGNSTYAYNYTSATDWGGSISLSKSNGYDGGVYYTSSVTTGTYGIGFGQFLNGILLPKHYYRITWVAYNNGGAKCAGPMSWATQLRTGTGNGNSVQVTRTYFNYIGLQNNISIFIDDPEATYSITGCSYTIVTAFSNAVSWINFPVNSSTTVNSQWNYYGYFIEDIGSTDTMTASDLNNSISTLQSNLNSSLTNQTNAINGNIDQEFNDLKNYDHNYNNNASENINGGSDINNLDSKENQLRNNLNLDTSSIDVQFDTTGSSFIWDIISTIRSINPKITLLFTTLLSLGVIKFILNR